MRVERTLCKDTCADTRERHRDDPECLMIDDFVHVIIMMMMIMIIMCYYIKRHADYGRSAITERDGQLLDIRYFMFAET